MQIRLTFSRLAVCVYQRRQSSASSPFLLFSWLVVWKRKKAWETERKRSTFYMQRMCLVNASARHLDSV